MRKLSKILVLVLVLMTVLTAVSAITASALSVRISGSWNGWGTANNTTLVDGLYIHKVDLAAGTYEFKVVEGSTWMGYNSTINNSTTNTSFTSSGGNAKLKVTTAGTFIFQWNASTNRLTIVQHSAHTLEVAETPATCTVDGLKTEKCTVVGCGYNVETVLKAQGHTYADGVCTVCGEAEPTEHVHFFVSEVTKAPTCTEKGELTWTCACGEDSYTTEAEMLEHTYKFGACTACGCAKPGYTYYLEGYINNADYTGTKYAFVDGKLTISAFTAASYIYVVDSEGNRFMTSAYSTKTTDTFVTTGAEKMLIPTGFDELTFTIVNNKNGTVTLSYEGKSNCNHNWVDATCQKAKHCTVCGELDGAVTNHYYWDGKCQWCDSTITEWVTVYVNNVANWDTVYFYAWSNTETIGTYMAWPGTAMVENEDGLLVAQIPAQYDNIIFNNGTAQTADLKVPTNSKVIFNNSANTWSCLHTWVDATCAAPKTCSGCGITDGEALAHTWVDATYSAPKTCSVCGATEGEALSLPGTGTEEDPFVIGSLEALIAFRDSVNAGETTYNAEGVYVALGADIDMAEVDWSVNIGDDCNATFDGIFDGKGHKILNLNATETAQKADGYVCSGLFGAIYGNAVIKNLVIENVSIDAGEFTGHNVAAVVGFVYSGTGSIENVTVCGDIKIDAKGVYGVGAIVGYSYYGSNLTIKDCKVVGNEGSYIKAASGAGAISGYAYGIHVVNAEVSGLTIEGAGLLGGLVGIAVNNSTDVNGAHVANVTLNATKDVWVNGTGIAVGTLSSNSIKIEGVTFENVTGADTLLGSAYAEKPETVVPAFVARIGDVYYTDIQEAIAAAQAGETVYVFAGTYALPSMKAGIAIEGVGEVLFEGTLSGTLENLTLKNLHIKGGNAQRWAYAKGDLVFENVIFEATGVYALHFDGITEGATLLYKDCTIIGWAAMSGSPASCVFDGCTIKGNGSYGVIRTYFDATIENCTFDVSNVNPDDVYQDGIHAVDATVTVNNCTNVNGEMKDIIDTSNVGYVVLDGETIHIHKYDEETVAATCTTAGSTTYTCPCGHTYTEEVEALGHDIVVDSAAVDATCTETGLTAGEHCSRCDYKVAQEVVEALGHAWTNCECANCDAVLPALAVTDSFDFTTAEGFDAALTGGKLLLTGEFRNNGDSHQFAADSSIQFVVPANTTVTITGHSTGYGVFDVYLNGEKNAMAGVFTVTVTEITKVVIVPNEDATYSKAYLKGIALAEYVDRTIVSDTTITFGSEGNYKDSIVDFSGIQIGDNGGNNSQVKNGSFNLELKAGAVVTIHGYPGYTSYKLNGGDEITSEYYTYIALEDTVLTVTPVNGNNYFYSIEIKFHEGITLVEAKDPTCAEAGHGAYYVCDCHEEALTDKGEVAALGHDMVTDEAVAPTCTAAGLTAGEHCSRCDHAVAQETVDALGHTEVVDAAVEATCTEAGKTEGKHCSVCNEVLVAQEDVPATGHTYVEGKCECGAEDPDYVEPSDPTEPTDPTEPSDPTEPTDPVEPTGFAKIWTAILAFFSKIAEMFKGFFAKG